MLRITRTANGGLVFKLSGRMETESLAELEMLLNAEAGGRHVLLDLSDLTLVDQGVVSFLKRSEADGIELKNCPAYVREWIKGLNLSEKTVNGSGKKQYFNSKKKRRTL